MRVTRQRYYPFGEMITGSGLVHGFTGTEFDSEMGLNYFCQRYYDPQTGRFMTRDLIPAINPYTYCINNPLKYIDPLGLDWNEWHENDEGVTVHGVRIPWPSAWDVMNEGLLGLGMDDGPGRPLPIIPLTEEEILSLHLAEFPDIRYGPNGFERILPETANSVRPYPFCSQILGEYIDYRGIYERVNIERLVSDLEYNRQVARGMTNVFTYTAIGAGVAAGVCTGVGAPIAATSFFGLYSGSAGGLGLLLTIGSPAGTFSGRELLGNIVSTSSVMFGDWKLALFMMYIGIMISDR